MNRFVLFVCLCCVLPAFSQAQSIGICNQVLSASGKSAIQSGRYYAYTVGQPFILTLEGTNHDLTQGFHQPDLCVLVATSDLDLADWSIEVYPNPTSDFLHIQYNAGQSGILQATVFDVLGHLVVASTPLYQPNDAQLDCTSWQAGVYFLQLRDPITQATATLRFVRL